VRLPRIPNLLLAVALPALAVVGLGCSSSTKTTGTTVPGTNAPAATSATTSAPAVTAPTTAAPAGLSGSWSGSYSGADSCTFTLMWQQTGSALSGTIKLSAAASGVPLSGTVQGSSIQFGTVGLGAVSYTWTFSGGSMSGTYKAGNGSGTWTATKSS
jgi:hypothetical protein